MKSILNVGLNVSKNEISNDLLKFGFSEKATKFEKNLRRTFDKSVVFCAKNLTKISFKRCGQVV